MNLPFENCVWIGGDRECESPIIIRRFCVHNPKKANLFVTGLGYFEVKVNGKEITDYRFLPVASDYEPRDLSKFLYPLHDVTTNRIYYYEFDIAGYLQEGENVLTIQLANGWYRQKERIGEGDVAFGDVLKAIYKVELDGQAALCSDGSEIWKESEIRYSNLFYGEVIDPGVVTAMEAPVSILPAPQAILSKEIGTPDKVIRTIKPKLLGTVNGKAVFDAGENISGVVEVQTNAPAGEQIVLRFAEKLDGKLNLDFFSSGGFMTGVTGRPQIMEDVFISDGKTRAYEPKFVWHAFRYFEVEGSFDSVLVKVIHSDTPVTAEFNSSAEGLNFLYDAYLRTQLDNMHGSFPSDCPHRERLGYTGDGQLCAPAAMLMLDCRAFYEKWIQDILDCQDIKSGHVQHTAPFMGGGGGPGGWGCAMVLVPYAFYKQYGDVAMLEKCYEPMRRWIEYLTTRCDDGLITREEEGGWCLGDWLTLDPTVIPAEYVNTCYFIKVLSIMEQIAQLLGKEQDIAPYRSLREKSEKAVTERFFTDGSYADGIQGADAYAVWCGLAGKETADRLAEKYDALGHFDTGCLATDILLEVLFDYGHGDTAIRLLAGEELGSYLYMKRQGATTLWENWKGEGSLNHPMFGAGARHLFTGVLGIRQREGTAGFEDVIIRPCLPEPLTYASGKLTTPHGDISVVLERINGEFKVTVSADEGITVELH